MMPKLRPAQPIAVALAAAVPTTLWIADGVLMRRRLREARRDPLTGLPLRAELTARAGRLAAREKDTAAILLDCVRFKDVNDTHGHAAGDALLAALAGRLTLWVTGRGGTAARIGGDEFAAAVPLPRDRNAAGLTLASLRRTLERPVPYGTQTLPVSVSIGAAHLADTPGRAWAQALRAADEAMYAAKAAGGRPVLADRGAGQAPTVNGRRPGRAGTHLPVGATAVDSR